MALAMVKEMSRFAPGTRTSAGTDRYRWTSGWRSSGIDSSSDAFKLVSIGCSLLLWNVCCGISHRLSCFFSSAARSSRRGPARPPAAWRAEAPWILCTAESSDSNDSSREIFIFLTSLPFFILLVHLYYLTQQSLPPSKLKLLHHPASIEDIADNTYSRRASKQKTAIPLGVFLLRSNSIIIRLLHCC